MHIYLVLTVVLLTIHTMSSKIGNTWSSHYLPLANFFSQIIWELLKNKWKLLLWTPIKQSIYLLQNLYSAPIHRLWKAHNRIMWMKCTTPFLKEKVAKKEKKIKTFSSIQAMFTWVKMSLIWDWIPTKPA